ncbi:MAG: nickel pincer cofactor biosynthesis protein LarC [Anaerolineae bacterium]
MRVALVEPFAGASGDMVLGAVVDAGVSVDELTAGLRGLGIGGWSLAATTVRPHGLRATHVEVTVDPAIRLAHWADVEGQITGAALSERVKRDSLRVFRRLFEAEGRVHGMSYDTVHLHEMGNLDTLIDVVGGVIGLERLGVERVFVAAFPAGRGTIRTQHGLLPSPGPAVMALLEGAPMRAVDIEAELVTPTGAAILTTLADGYGAFPTLTVEALGYGAGTRALPFANVLRLVVGAAADRPAEGLVEERITLLETQIDDMPPEWYEYVIGRLLATGALDAYMTPVLMKKNRPGVLLTVLCRPERAEEVAGVVLSETTTLGIRRQDVDRLSLPREIVMVETEYGPIAAKVATLPSGLRRAAPEYEACRVVAEARGVPLWQVYRAVERAYHEEADSL